MVYTMVGDHIFGRDGRTVTVRTVGPIYHDRACYRVTFTDRTSIVADASHVWTAMDRAVFDRPEREYTTEQLYHLIGEWEARGIEQANRIGLPSASAIDLPETDLLVDPYVLGTWLGDGETAGAAIVGAVEDLAFIGPEIERRGYTVTRWAARSRTPVIGLPGGLLSALDALEVLGDKKIPAPYLRASRAQRLDLLRGLMDTDGTVSDGHTAVYGSKLEALARSVAEVVRSLGYRATVSSYDDSRSRTGKHWRVRFRARRSDNPFLLPRKAARVRNDGHVKNRAIVSVEPVGSVPVRCIAVDSPDHLFLAGDGWTVTHNTRIAALTGMHPVVAALSEGLQGSSLNAGNFGSAARLVGDATLRPLWGDMAGSLETIIRPPRDGTRLWFDDRSVAFLRSDVADQADIIQKQGATIGQLVKDGFTPESSVAAVVTGDMNLLVHTGMTSVQLLPPLSQPAAAHRASREFWSIDVPYASMGVIPAGAVVPAGHPILAAYPSMFEPVPDVPQLPARAGGPGLIVTREQVVAKRIELLRLGQPAGHNSVARALLCSPDTIRRRLKQGD
jgi:hypothetical protein